MVYTYNIFKFVIGNIYENVSYGNTHFVWLAYSSFLCFHFVAKYLNERWIFFQGLLAHKI